jgi:AhpC/TSA family
MSFQAQRGKVIVAAALLVVATSLFAGDVPKAIGKKAVSFTLEDQFERKWTWSKHWMGKPTVLVMSDWKGSDYTMSWTTPLTEAFKERVQFVALADVSLAPSFIHEVLRTKFRESYTYSILLDWDGDVFKHYLVQPGLPNVIFIDAEGTVRLHTWGKGAANHVNAFAKELEKLL